MRVVGFCLSPMSQEPVTIALARVERGEPGAQERLWELVYEDLKRLASARLCKLAPGQTLQATALVHEVWVRLSGGAKQWEGRAHFFGAAARSMRNILVDQARRKQRQRSDSAPADVRLSTDIVIADIGADGTDILALDEAMTALAREYERPSHIVMLRFFAGLSSDEIAELLEITPRTIDRDLLFARTWLRRYLDRA